MNSPDSVPSHANQFHLEPARSFANPSLEDLARLFNLELAHVREAVAHYNRDYAAYGNEIYTTLESRIAHWCNYLDGGWFQDRVTRWLERVPGYDVVVDLGFSVPYSYTIEAVRRQAGPRYVFVDKEESALAFSRRVSAHLAPNRSDLDSFVKANICRADEHPSVVEATRALAPDRLFIVCSETLEHLEHPDVAWSLIRELSALAPGRTDVFVTLPIGEQIPSHAWQFDTPEAAQRWLEAWIAPRSVEVLSPGPGETSSRYLRQCLCVVGPVVPEH